MLKKVLGVIFGLVLSFGLVVAPVQSVYADEQDEQTTDTTDTNNGGDKSNCVKTSILGSGGEYCDSSGNGGGIFLVLGIVVDILTMGVAVLATLGIIISGFQYITSSGNSQQMSKAKNRIIEIVLGLVVYGVMWAVLQWLIPGGIFGGDPGSDSGSSSNEPDFTSLVCDEDVTIG